MGKFSFLKQKKFYINLLLIILLTIFLLWLAIKLLNVYTRHGKVFEMPDLTGLTTEQIEKDYGKDYHFILIDSVYSKKDAPGTIVQQDPLPKAKVKHGRNVYYIIVAKAPEKVNMPNLNNLSLRQAMVLLESNGLILDELQYVEYFARNAILEQQYNGEIIKPGTEINKGSKITLIVGIGEGNKKMQLPMLYGTPAEDVKHTLNMAGLNLGEQVFEDNDSLKYLRVYKMDPLYSQKSVEPGSFVNVWYRSSKTTNFDKELKKLIMEDSIAFATEQQRLLDSIAALNEINTESYEDEF